MNVTSPDNHSPRQADSIAEPLQIPRDATLPPAYNLEAFTDTVARYTLQDGGIAIGRYLGRLSKSGNLMMSSGYTRYDKEGKQLTGQTTLDPKDICTIEAPGFSKYDWEQFQQKWLNVTMINGTRFEGAFVNFNERCNLVCLSNYTRFAPDGKELFKRGWGHIDNAYVDSIVEIKSQQEDWE